VEILLSKPVLIGIHLTFAIIGIDSLLWLLGEFVADTQSRARRVGVATLGVAGFTASWITGGYYYVKFYGSLVKPAILNGSAPWAHTIVMEAKEHIFLFIIPLALVVLTLALLDQATLKVLKLKTRAVLLCALVPIIGLVIGMMGFIISAAARWGVT